MDADNVAFAALVRKYQGMVYSIAWNYLRNRAVAEEIAQEVFLELHRRLDRIEGEAHAIRFLRKVAAHRCVDEGRRAKNRPRLGLDDVPERGVIPKQKDPFLGEALGRLVASLPARSRMMVILRYQEEMEPGEIASALDIPLGTVKSGLHRALTVLRRRIERTWKGVPQWQTLQ
jgi:RNA polymerase sigma-70 factor (ECF subfamily)